MYQALVLDSAKRRSDVREDCGTVRARLAFVCLYFSLTALDRFKIRLSKNLKAAQTVERILTVLGAIIISGVSRTYGTNFNPIEATLTLDQHCYEIKFGCVVRFQVGSNSFS